MAATTTLAGLSLALMAMALTAEGSEGTEQRPSVFVHIENQAGVMPEVISGARKELLHLFNDTGVRVESSAEPDHDACLGQLTIHVLLLGGSVADRFIAQEHVKSTTLALANSDARRVHVFWNRIGPAVDRQAVPHGDALGIVIAHEIGHVLLPGRTHSPSGLMRGNYEVYLSYGLKFSAEEAAAMRLFIAAAMRHR